MQSYKDAGVIKDEEVTKLNELNSRLDLLQSKLSQSKDEANRLKENIVNTTKNKFNLPGIKDVNRGIKSVNTNIEKFGKKISRMMFATFVFNAMRSSLSQLRSSLVSLLKTDDNFSNSLNQIKANMMTAFAPIYNAVLPAINELMNGLVKLTGTIAKFTASLFGKSLSDASKDAKKLSSNLKDVSKNGDKASGSLASFDNLEVIAEESDSSSSGTGIDYSKDIEYSETLLNFLNKIKNFVTKNKGLILGLLAGISAGLLLIKVGCEGITALGIGLLIGGIIMGIQSIVDYLNDPSWENFGNIIEAIGIAIIGLGAIFGSLPLAIGGAIVLILGLLAKNWDTVKDKTLKAVDWLLEKLTYWFGPLGTIAGTSIKAIVVTALGIFDGLFTGVKKILDGIIKIFKGDFKGGIVDVIDGIGNIFIGLINGITSGFNVLIDGLNKVHINTPEWIPIIGGKNWNGFNIKKIPQIPKLAQGAVIPPRQEFMAILGDQKHGTNIEAPIETIKQALREVQNESNGGVIENLTIVCQMGSKTAQKFVIDQVRQEEIDTGEALFVS